MIEPIFERRLISCKRKAEAANVAFELTLDDLVGLYHIQDGRCAITGIKLSLERRRGQRGFPPESVAIDLIAPAMGYILGNIRLVTFAVSRILSPYGEEKLKEIALAYVKHRLLKTSV